MQQEVEYLLQHGFGIPSCYHVTITKPDSFPVPQIEDCIDRVGSANFVTKLDLLKGHWQVPLTPHASELSAFVTPDHFFTVYGNAFWPQERPYHIPATYV